MIKAYLKYRKSRLNAYGLHSPFLFEFYNEVLKKTHLSADVTLEALRKQLKKDVRSIDVLDLGAGSKVDVGTKRRISSIVKSTSIPKKYGQLLRRITEKYELNSALELGTSLGIGTLYLAGAKNKPTVVTLEGCPNIHALAAANFKALKNTRIDARLGSFDAALKKIEPTEQFDLIYIDGNHTREATLNYFDFALNHTHDQSFIIFDDIHWNAAMEEAWNEICHSKSVNVSMDLFRLGIVLKRKGQRKQHFVLKY